MIEEKDMTAAAPVALRDEEGAVREDYVERVAQAIADGDAAALRELVGDLHEADVGDLIEALDPDLRPRLIKLMGHDFDFSALTEVDDTVREEILEELPAETVAEGVRELDSDDAVAILEDLPKDEQAEILDQMPASERVALARSLRISGGLGRPADADRVHRRAADLDRRADHRLHARDAGAARSLLRALRRR